ncbi:MAG: hypothetical protein PUJ82_07030 [Spirochaetales bacterium]|nr:hypothetical protein [Spirochaetales bacterium]
MCFFIQFYFVYCESPVEIINKIKEEFSNEYDFLVYKSTVDSIKIIKNKKVLLINIPMKVIPYSQKIKMSNTEVTQELYKAVMGENPSSFVGEQLSVECVSWYDAIYFCNLLSEIFFLTNIEYWD